MKKAVLTGLVFCLAVVGCKSPNSSEPKNLPTVLSFYAIPSEIDKGESTELSWNTINAATATIDNGVGSVSASGSKTVSPTTTTTYALTLTNPDGTTTASTTVTVKEVAVIVLDGKPSKKMTSYDRPYFSGYVRNDGAVTGYNVMIVFHAYSDSNKHTIIDTASGFPANLGNIGAGQRAYYEAVFFNLTNWNQIKSWDYVITWLNLNVGPELQNGIITGWNF